MKVVRHHDNSVDATGSTTATACSSSDDPSFNKIMNREKDSRNLLLLEEEERSNASWKQAHSQKLLEAAIFSQGRQLYQAALKHEREARELLRRQGNNTTKSKSSSSSSKSDMLMMVRKASIPERNIIKRKNRHRRHHKKRKGKRRRKRRKEPIEFALDDNTDGEETSTIKTRSSTTTTKSSLQDDLLFGITFTCCGGEQDAVATACGTSVLHNCAGKEKQDGRNKGKKDGKRITHKSKESSSSPSAVAPVARSSINPISCSPVVVKDGTTTTQKTEDKGESLPSVSPSSNPYLSCSPAVEEESLKQDYATEQNDLTILPAPAAAPAPPRSLPKPVRKTTVAPYPAMCSMLDLDVSLEETINSAAQHDEVDKAVKQEIQPDKNKKKEKRSKYGPPAIVISPSATATAEEEPPRIRAVPKASSQQEEDSLVYSLPPPVASTVFEPKMEEPKQETKSNSKNKKSTLKTKKDEDDKAAKSNKKDSEPKKKNIRPDNNSKKEKRSKYGPPAIVISPSATAAAEGEPPSIRAAPKASSQQEQEQQWQQQMKQPNSNQTTHRASSPLSASCAPMQHGTNTSALEKAVTNDEDDAVRKNVAMIQQELEQVEKQHQSIREELMRGLSPLFSCGNENVVSEEDGKKGMGRDGEETSTVKTRSSTTTKKSSVQDDLLFPCGGGEQDVVAEDEAAEDDGRNKDKKHGKRIPRKDKVSSSSPAAVASASPSSINPFSCSPVVVKDGTAKKDDKPSESPSGNPYFSCSPAVETEESFKQGHVTERNEFSILPAPGSTGTATATDAPPPRSPSKPVRNTDVAPYPTMCSLLDLDVSRIETINSVAEQHDDKAVKSGNHNTEVAIQQDKYSKKEKGSKYGPPTIFISPSSTAAVAEEEPPRIRAVPKASPQQEVQQQEDDSLVYSLPTTVASSVFKPKMEEPNKEIESPSRNKKSPPETKQATIVLDLTDKDESDFVDMSKSSDPMNSNKHHRNKSSSNLLLELWKDFIYAGECALNDVIMGHHNDSCSQGCDSTLKSDDSSWGSSWTCGYYYSTCGSISLCHSNVPASEAYGTTRETAPQQQQAQQQQQPLATKNVIWKPLKDPKTGRTYYYHKVSKETTWTKPPQDKMLLSASPSSSVITNGSSLIVIGGFGPCRFSCKAIVIIDTTTVHLVGHPRWLGWLETAPPLFIDE